MSNYLLINMRLIICLALIACQDPPNPRFHPDLNYNLDEQLPRSPYNDSPIKAAANTLDVLEPDKSGRPCPIMLYVHGGGWAMGDKSMTHSKGQLFAQNGFLFVSVNYRLSPFPVDRDYPANRVTSPAHAEDVAEAIAWLQIHAQDYNADPRNITLIGHSAGAQIVSLLGTDPSYLEARKVSPKVIKAVIALDSAAFDIALSIEQEPLTPMRLQAFGTRAENKAKGTWKALSATAHADQNDPPFLLVTQTTEPTRIAQCLSLAEALGQPRQEAVLAVDKSHSQINHDLGAKGDDSPLTKTVLAFVKRHSMDL